MLRTADARTFVLLEGPTDCQALDAHIDSSQAKTLPGYSKSAVQRAISLVDANGPARVVAILDLDWAGLVDQSLQSSNVIYADDYDLDATILLCGDVMQRLVGATTDKDKVERMSQKCGCGPNELVVRLAGPIGVGRFVSHRDRLELRFAGFPAHVAMTNDSADIDLGKLAQTAIGRSVHPGVSETELVARIRTEIEKHESLRRFCNGHDLAMVLAILIRGVWGGGGIGRDTVEQVGRAALSCANLRATAVFAQVSAWAEGAGTRVWACPVEDDAISTG